MSLADNNSTYSHDPVKARRFLELWPQVLGTGDTIPFSVDCRLTYYRLVNKTAGAITVSVADRQPTPIYALPPVVLPPNGFILFNSENGGDPCPNGVVINCSAAGIHAHAKAEVQ